MNKPIPFNALLSKRIKHLMAQQQQTQECVAEEAGVSSSTVRYLLAGKNSRISTLMAVLYALDAGPKDLDGIHADYAASQRGVVR